MYEMTSRGERDRSLGQMQPGARVVTIKGARLEYSC